jgi:hypothetical protein
VNLRNELAATNERFHLHEVERQSRGHEDGEEERVDPVRGSLDAIKAQQVPAARVRI